MSRHAAHWAPAPNVATWSRSDRVLTDEDSYGLAVVETDDEQALREFAAQDPVVTTRTAAFELRTDGGGSRPGALTRALSTIASIAAMTTDGPSLRREAVGISVCLPG